MNTIESLIKKIRHSSRELVRELGLVSQESAYGVPLSLRHALIELEIHRELTHIELAALLRLDKSTVSRLIKSLLQRKLVAITSAADDKRFKSISLTKAGESACEHINLIANTQVQAAMLQLSAVDKSTVISGLELYAKALKRSRIQSEYHIRPILKKDNHELMTLIKTISKEFGTNKPGFAFVDPELENMHKSFSGGRQAYFVIERVADKKIMGGAGMGELAGGKESVCELKKMYLHADARGLGLGYALLETVLSSAKKSSYKKCYLETLKSMVQANQLYQKSGFIPLDKPLGNTGHFGCDAWYLKTW